MKRTSRPARHGHEVGSGNVYADLAYADPEAMLLKARLVTKIAHSLAGRELAQARAARLLGMSQAALSSLLHGRFRAISVLELIGFLTCLGHDVEIVVRPAMRTRGRGVLSVAFPR